VSENEKPGARPGLLDERLDTFIVSPYRAVCKRAMDYPKDFPEHLKALVDAAFSEAEIEFTKIRKDSHTWAFEDIERLTKRYIRRVLLAFAEAACRAVEEGLWSGETFRREYDRYLYALTNYVCQKKHPNPFNQSAIIDLRRSIGSQVEDTDNWVAIQARLKQAVESQPNPRVPRTELQTEVLPTSPAKRSRLVLVPNPHLLKDKEIVEKGTAARALGVSVRTLDRYVEDKRLTPLAAYSRRRFKTKDLLAFMSRKEKDK